MYADDMILLSPLDCHLQDLLNICSNYDKLWRLKFNTAKSNTIEFGPQLFTKSEFYLENKTLCKTNKIKYLGVEINNKLDFDKLAIEKFSKVQKSVFSIPFLGLKPKSVASKLQAFIFKTYCLSQFIYALETTTLKGSTREYLNIAQNNLIR